MGSRLPVWIFLSIAVTALFPASGMGCVGDCNGDAKVSINELVTAVQISLGAAEISACDAIDNNRDGQATINELIRGVTKGLTNCALGPAGEVLFSTHDHQLDEFDLPTGARTTTIPSTRARVTGQSCLFPGGAGDYVVGDDAASSGGGWSTFSPDGTFLRALALPFVQSPSLNQVGEPIGAPVGCAIDSSGRVFGTAYSAERQDGQLWVYFPPSYLVVGSACILDWTLENPGAMAIDADGALYVPEAGTVGRVLRFAPPLPSSQSECPDTVPLQLPRTTFIEYADGALPVAIAQAANGHWFVSVRGGSQEGSSIREHAADGTFVREVLPAGSGGDPTGIAFDSLGNLYYADAGLQAGTSAAAAGKGTIRKIAFDQDGEPSAPELVASGLTDPDGVSVFPSRAAEWLTLGGSLRRTYFNPREHVITPDSASQLIAKWKYPTSGMISAQTAVTWVDLPGEGRTQIVIFPSWDGNVYALRAENGSRVWRYLMKPQPGTFYPYSGSPSVGWVGGQQRIYIAGGETMYCLDATTGGEIWQFDAGTGCTNCTARQERNEIESSPALIEGKVIVGMDTNDGAPGRGAMLALDAVDGRLVWWFDMVSQTTCRPLPDDNIRRFDGFHTAAALGLPDGFLETRPGCDFDRSSIGCGNVWSSAAVDARRRLLYSVSSNCDTDDDPSTPAPPVTPALDEAIFALTLDGDVAWVWRPREVDPDDLDFGAVPNLFEAEIGGAVREVVGVGGKDGTYYVLDRDGTNQISGVTEPYWRTNVVPGGAIGGIIGSASVGEGQVVFETGFGLSISEPQKPAVHALDARDGSILWENSDVDTGYAPAGGVPGLALVGGTPRPNLNVFKRDTGAILKTLLASPVPSGVAAAPAVVGGQIFVGAGTGAFNSGSDADREARRDTSLSAFCVQGTPGCVANTCNDGNPCTYDYRAHDGSCASEPGADGLDCNVGGTVGQCALGACAVP